MNVTIPDWLRPVLSRLIASVVASVLSYAAHKGLDLGLSDADKAHLTDAMLAVMLGVWGVAYAAVHRALSARQNPTDSASPSLSSVATGPMGEGERTRLAQKLDAAAEAPNVVKVTRRPEQSIPVESFGPVPERPAFATETVTTTTTTKPPRKRAAPKTAATAETAPSVEQAPAPYTPPPDAARALDRHASEEGA